jgi:hypothetical protein
LRLGVQSTTGDNHDQQAKKEGKQESKQAGGVCGGTPDYDGKIKEAAHKRAKPLAGLAFRCAVEEGVSCYEAKCQTKQRF